MGFELSRDDLACLKRVRAQTSRLLGCRLAWSALLQRAMWSERPCVQEAGNATPIKVYSLGLLGLPDDFWEDVLRVVHAPEDARLS